jgi:hypothetical protein
MSYVWCISYPCEVQNPKHCINTYTMGNLKCAMYDPIIIIIARIFLI